jgi:hypothetical protein
VLQVQQRHHQANGQAWPAGVADASAGHSQGWAKHVRTFAQPTCAIEVREHRRQRPFDLGPRHPRSQHRQRVAQVNHQVKPGAEEVVGGHRAGSSISQESISIGLKTGGLRHRKSPESRYETTGCEFCRGD